MTRLKKAFLESFRQHGNITRACRLSTASRSSVYRWKDEDDQFASDFHVAEMEATEHLEEAAYVRAVEGVRRLKFERGEAILDPATGEPYTEMECSDTLLIFLLKARAPEKYRERHDIKHGGQIEHVQMDAARTVLRVDGGASS